MGTEIERKYLVKGDGWRALAEGVHYRQGYLNSAKERTVRVRSTATKRTSRSRASRWGPLARSTSTRFPSQTAMPCSTRSPGVRIPHGGFTIEVDEFLGENAGLVVAEVELKSEGQTFDKPAWLGEEVTGDPKYYNANLVKHPYSKW